MRGKVVCPLYFILMNSTAAVYLCSLVFGAWSIRIHVVMIELWLVVTLLLSLHIMWMCISLVKLVEVFFSLFRLFATGFIFRWIKIVIVITDDKPIGTHYTIASITLWHRKTDVVNRAGHKAFISVELSYTRRCRLAKTARRLRREDRLVLTAAQKLVSTD